MHKTIFKIAKMDCPSEEQMVRMKLEGLTNIHSLHFNLHNRQLTVIHSDSYNEILRRLDTLNFDVSFISSNEIDTPAETDRNDQQSKVLRQVLIINISFFVLEIVTGFIGKSIGLIADSLDMLADSLVYGLALFAVGGTVYLKKNIAKASGYLQLTLAVFGLAEVLRRFISVELLPEFGVMMTISFLALIGNATCLYLLQRSETKEAHMKASMIFTSTDVVANLGVIVAGVLVLLTNSKYPDLIVGFIVFLLVGFGALKILRLSK